MLAEYAANNYSSEATNLSPIFALHGYHPPALTNLLSTGEPASGYHDTLAGTTATQEIHAYL